MNYSRAERFDAPQQEPEYILGDNDNVERLERSTWRTRKLDRQAARTERDRARGYSINVKQVVLAFAIEFFIIGIVLVGQVYLVLDSSGSTERVVPALLFPLALAVIELARVPLAVSVRTAQSWNIQLASLVGVCCAVVVTSVSLYQIGHNTFHPRLENVNAKRMQLQEVKSKRDDFGAWKRNAESVIAKIRQDRDSLAERHTSLFNSMTKQPAQDCSPTFQKLPDGSERRGQICRPNPLLKQMQADVAGAKQNLQAGELALSQAEAKLANDLATYRGSHEPEVRRAEAEYRTAIYQSPLHSYTGMLFGKDAAEVTEGEVKTLQKYLIGVPAIAAALASTLIAMAAVRRIPRRDPDEPVRLPDEAVAYLFGPLVSALRAEADSAVKAALRANADSRAQGPPAETATGPRSGT